MPQFVHRDSWSRRELFDFFSRMSNPFYSLTFKLDVTRLYEYTKARQISFYYALVYLSARAVNSVENFRYAIDQGRVVLLDQREPSFIATTVEKKQMLLFNSAASECRGGPQSGQVADFIVSTGVYPHSGCAAV